MTVNSSNRPVSPSSVVPFRLAALRMPSGKNWSRDVTQVFVVDDNTDMRDILRLLLEDDGYAVVEDSDGTTVVDYLRATPYGLVVLFDYRMPHLDAEAFLTQVLSEHSLAARHSFICVTGFSRDRLPPSFLALQDRLDVPLLTKPFDIDDLLAAIKQAEQRLQQ